MTPHFGHAEVMIVAMVAAVHMDILVKHKNENNTKTVSAWSERGSVYYLELVLDLRLQALTPSNHM